MINIANPFLQFVKSKLFQNSLWGISSSIFQNLVFSIFFILMARTLDSSTFSSYIIANTFYGLILSFSSLGMSQWFIRNVVNAADKNSIVNQYFYIQLISGVLFYMLQVVLVFQFYDEALIRNLSLILGINILFDNIIYVYKSVNIAFNAQRKTFLVTSVEAFFKLITAFLVWKTGLLNIISIVSILVVLRFITVIVFMNFGIQDSFRIKLFPVKQPLYIFHLFNVITQNKYFLLIGSISVIFWSIGNIMVSKIIGLNAVPSYEISFKLFSMGEVIPLMFSASVFPIFVKKTSNDIQGRNIYFKKLFWVYAGYGLFSFSLIFSFSDYFIPILFGSQYGQTSSYVKEMFLTMLLFPTSLLQANLIIAMGFEKKDMWFNLTILIINSILSFSGLYLVNSLSIINYSIFFSFLIFHLLQDYFLFKEGIIVKRDILIFYLVITAIFTLFLLTKESVFVFI